MSTTTAPIEAPVATRGRASEPMSSRIVRFLTKTPVYLVLAFIGLLWLVPTLGLFFTSLLEPSAIGTTGWWEVLSSPSLATIDNYREILDNEAITSAIWTTLWISLGATILPIVVAALAAYAFAWLEFPGRDWLFLVVVALLVVPIQMALIPIFSLYNDLGLFDTIPGSSSSTRRSGCRSRSSCCATSSSGSPATCSRRRGSTAPPSSGSSSA